MYYPKHAETVGITSSCFTSTRGPVLLRHTKRMKTLQEDLLSQEGIIAFTAKKVADGQSTLAKKRKYIPTTGSLFRKPSTVDKQGIRRRELNKRISRNLASQELASSQVLVKGEISRF